MTRSRPFGITILAIISGLAGVIAAYHTLQYLHISEYGKICAKFPQKAREVRSGAPISTRARSATRIVDPPLTATGVGGMSSIDFHRPDAITRCCSPAAE